MKRTPINTDPEKVRAWQQRSRRNLPAQSAKRAAEKPERDRVRAEVFTRDRNLCQLRAEPGLPPCFGALSVHHLRKASAGGSYSLDNLTTLCIGHNDLMEDEPLLAKRLGMVVR
jgi:5-methylcytosine-specific restriction endonuclease McrA